MNTDAPSTPQAFVSAVAEVRSLGIVVVKSARNSHLNSDYATFIDVWEKVAPELKERGIAIGWKAGTVRKDNDAWVQSLTLEVSAHGHLECVPFEVLVPEAIISRSGGSVVNLAQRQGSAQTYGKRYALINYFNIITGDDDDAARLGQQRVEESAPVAAPNQHWEELCHCPLFATGHEETQGTWAMLADPSGDGSQTLGDLKDGRKAVLWQRFPTNPGLNAWRAEVVQFRAASKGYADWEACRAANSSLNLPQYFRECSGEQLNNLSLALR